MASREGALNQGTTPEQLTGAVMVVGAGIAGIQASLDLAEAGFKVYLVETRSAIGGHMAQLDKTFPTNDCAMCILSPKLVDAGRHRNIELLVDSDVVGLSGEPGNFTVRVRTRPRYVDLEKCTGCSDCAAVCPVSLPDEFNGGLARRKAIYSLYPQAVPNAFAIEKAGRAPCTAACPAGVSAQGYIALIRQRRYADALRLIRQRIPFPSVCGRTCHHPCEGHCNRRLVDEPVAIQALKRFVTDRVYLGYTPPPQPVPRTRPERVAIVGAGPAGLTAAQDLVRLGYGVTVFEALPEPGGLMRFGIPQHRLPKDVLQRDISDILALGVELKVNTPITDPLRLLEEFDAVYLAVGVYGEHRLEVEGETLTGVFSAISMLRNVNLGQFPDLGQRVAVVGGGITAVDAATTALRLGARQVYLIYRRGRGEIPAYGWELDEAENEGVTLIQRAVVTRILGQDGRVSGVEYAATQSGPPGPDGRPTVLPVPGTEQTLAVDTVIRALGQVSDLWYLEHPPEAYVGDPQTLATSVRGLFAGPGQVVGAGFIINAIAQGHQAATSIHRFLQGEPLLQPAAEKVPVATWSEAKAKARVSRGEIEPRPRQPRPLLPLRERVERFLEVDMGFTESMALAEAARCLDCGVCSECGQCEIACLAGAIDHQMVERVQDIQVGAVVLAPGYEAYHAEKATEYGWGRFPNVVTALQYERLLSASGPTQGHIRRPSDGRVPKKIAFFQCVGSRDQTHDYCSSVCCMFATKEAIMSIEHKADTEVTIFMMDMRAFSKGYLEFYHRAHERYGIRYVRCRPSAVLQDPQTHNLIVRYVEVGDNGLPAGGSDLLREEEFDLVVLSVGMEMAQGVRELGQRLGVELDEHGFCRTQPFEPLMTSRPGILAIGPFREPKDIPESVMEGSGAAGLAGTILAPARWTMTATPTPVPERDVRDESPRIGVFVCHCGSNIGGMLDVPAVASYAATLPGVVHAEHNLYTCSQDTIRHITEVTRELGLNRVVVAACTPLTHEPLFQEAIREAGLNPNLFEMANIRNQCSWVHPDQWEEATRKARDLVRMAVAKAARLEPLHKTAVEVQKAALVVGGGAAGMTAALTLARQGFPVHLVEREDHLGGNLLRLHHYVQAVGGAEGVLWLDPRAYARDLIGQVETEPLIQVHLNAELVDVSGFVGNFRSRLRGPDGEQEIRHGAVVIATGGVEYRGPEYGYGSDPRILTQHEFESLLADHEGGKAASAADLPSAVVMIQCVGPAEHYCSRICCTTALKNALALKRLKPQAQVVVLYRDMRAPGFKERLYQEARRAGVLFVRFDFDRKPLVKGGPGSGLEVAVWDRSLGQEVRFNPDLVVLSMPVVPAEGAHDLSARLKLPIDLDGFFLEAHVKLRPVDFSSDGFFLAGMAHYPKFLSEAVAQAEAAAARAATILARDTLEVGGVVAEVDAEKCVGCLTCVRICPYHVPQVRADWQGVGGIVGAAYIEPAQCHGCGSCVAECPARAIQLLHYRTGQMEAKIAAVFEIPSPCTL